MQKEVGTPAAGLQTCPRRQVLKERILAIDDDSNVTSVLKRALGYEGYTVDIASSGKEGLDIARQRPPDLVILDIMMPGIDGLEVCRRLRSVDDKLPILMLTAKDAISVRAPPCQGAGPAAPPRARGQGGAAVPRPHS